VKKRPDRARRASGSQAPQSLQGLGDGDALMAADGQQMPAVTRDDEIGAGGT